LASIGVFGKILRQASEFLIMTELVKSKQYVIVPVGPHLIELIKRNRINVVAAIDYRNNGSLGKSGIDKLTSTIYKIGEEAKKPFVSILSNIQYYKKLANILDKYPSAIFVITCNYTPFNRFIIDYVGIDRIELWEDGMNHYIRMEQLGLSYYVKAVLKLLAGYYPKHSFDNQYRSAELSVKDRFIHKNLEYKRIKLEGNGHYYIGQPLIQDGLVSERILYKTLADFVKKLNVATVYYIPHPRETRLTKLKEIFKILKVDCSAEEYLRKKGAYGVYSSFSTVNMNLLAEKNLYLCKAMGLRKIYNKLKSCDFDIEFV